MPGFRIRLIPVATSSRLRFIAAAQISTRPLVEGRAICGFFALMAIIPVAQDTSIKQKAENRGMFDFFEKGFGGS